MRAECAWAQRLAEEAPADADLVMPIPDSGTPAAIGFAKASGIPYEEGLIKNRYVGRTFIQPDQELRRQGIRLKFNPLDEIAGRRVVIVDDSIVRGNTMQQLIAMLVDAGAAEVHVRISSPPVVSPCFYGIDMADEDELAAAHRSVEEMREYIGATSLHYLSLEGMQWASRGCPRARSAAPASRASIRPRCRPVAAPRCGSRPPRCSDSPGPDVGCERGGSRCDARGRHLAPFVALEAATALSGTANGVSMVAFPWLVLELTGVRRRLRRSARSPCFRCFSRRSSPGRSSTWSAGAGSRSRATCSRS